MRELPAATLDSQHPVFELPRDDGTATRLGVITQPLHVDGEDEPRGTLLRLADMTEKNLAEQAASEAESVRELIAQASNDAIWDWDLGADFIWWSEGLQAQFGHRGDAANRRESWLATIHPEDRRHVEASWRSLFKGRDHVWLREFRFQTASGEFNPVICRGHLVRADNGRPVRMFGAMQDMSRLKRAEDELHQVEELSRAVLSSLSARIGVLDRNGIIIEVNDAWRDFERNLRPSTEAPCLVGTDYVAVRGGVGGFSGDGVAQEAKRAIQGVLRGKRRRADLDYQFGASEAAHWFAMHVEPLRTDKGGAVVLHIETTMRRRAEQAEIRSLFAEESEKAKTNLLNVVSHELRTPLAVIRGHVTTILEYGERMTEEQRRKSLESADAAAQQLERLVADLLTMGRLDAGMMRLECRPHPVEAIVRDAVHGVEAIAHRHIEVRVPEEPLEIHVDRARIIQVFYNLLDNAIKYGKPDGRIRVEVGVAKQNMVLVVVENGGTGGVRQSDVERVFERFFRTDHGMKLNVAGAGLGLAISKGIVEAHHGRIWARIRRGVFQVYLLLPKLPVSGTEAASA